MNISMNINRVIFLQVNSAVLAVRERNTYSRDTPNQLSRSTETYGEPSALLNSSGFNNNHSTGTQVGKIMENSRQKAKMMVDAAVQVLTFGEVG